MAISVRSKKKEKSVDEYIELYLNELEYLPSIGDKLDKAGYFARASRMPLDQFLMQVILYLKE